MSYAVFQNERYPKLYGGAAEFWKCKSLEVILSGPYETGKTYAALTKFHALMCKYPGAQGLMVRQTYKSLLSSACVTYETKVLSYPPGSSKSPIVKYGGEKPDFYGYPNGSRIWIGGLDHPDKFLSAEFDFIYVNQAEEVELDAWEKLVGRATGRAGHAPYTQVMGDCNPSFPWHWIQTRSMNGPLKLIEQRHEFNPALFNQETGEITEQGKISLASLDALTGIRYLRGRKGLWVAAEGVIFDNFSLDENVATEADYHPEWDVYWGVDDGYAYGQGPGSASYHPRVFLLAHVTPQGGVYVFDEYVHCGELSDHSLDNVIALPYKLPIVAYVDSSATELMARIWSKNISATGGTHPVSEGIKNVRRLICDGNNVRLLKIHPRCQHTIRELQSYRYAGGNTATAGEPRPEKVDDHCPDSLRYLTWHLRFNT